MSFAAKYFAETRDLAERLDTDAVDRLAAALAALRERGGRLFCIGVGGGAGNCGHAVNDFRKLCGIEAYAPTDNVSELTARTNDEGFETIFSEYLKTSRGGERDAVFVFSVGGGDAGRGISENLVRGLEEAKARGMKVFGVVGRDGGYTKQVGDEVVVVPVAHADRVTSHTEAFQAVVWHCLVSHPRLQRFPTKWESETRLREARLRPEASRLGEARSGGPASLPSVGRPVLRSSGAAAAEGGSRLSGGCGRGRTEGTRGKGGTRKGA